MPTTTEILELLERISSELIVAAIIFHALIFVFLVALAAGWRPSKKLSGILLSLPLLSVSSIAWIYGTPFNGAIFMLFFALLFFFSFKLDTGHVKIATGWKLIAAFVLIAFGLFYPHFLNCHPAMYLIAAPTGLIPCPTLSLVIGFALLFNSFNSRRWAITLSLIALFYGVFGVMKLGVYIDGVLLAGVVTLGAVALGIKMQTSKHIHLHNLNYQHNCKRD